MLSHTWPRGLWFAHNDYSPNVFQLHNGNTCKFISKSQSLLVFKDSKWFNEQLMVAAWILRIHHNHGMLERLVELLAVNIHIFVWVLPRGSWKYRAGLTVMHLLVGKFPNGGWSAKIILAGGISSHSNDSQFLYWSRYLNPAGYI